MQAALLYSAPNEKYLDHISRCKDKFDLVFPMFDSTISRVLDISIKQGSLADFLLKMILFHDLGKLTERWQKNVGTNKQLPSHSTLGAAFLWKTLPDGIKEPLSFAVAIHHTDRGLLGDNIEKPDVQAILDGIVDNNGNIVWHDEIKNLTEDYFPKEAHDLNVSSLKEMARGLRVWAKGCPLLEQHQRRLQASLAHHILKLCDISAATDRKEYKKKDGQDYYGGWLMVENIKNYVESISVRNRYSVLQSELSRWINILKETYSPEKIILFGSFVDGKIGEWSDIDLVIIKDIRKPFLERTKEVLLLLHPRVGVDILVYTPQEFKRLSETKLFFKEEIFKKGKIIYER